TVVASPASAQALREGRPVPDDPQFTAPGNGFPAVKNVKVIGDREVLTVGNVRITARFTPGHTPGSTSWTWQSCEQERCFDVVYADSLNAVSADEFRFTDRASLVESFERSIRTIGALPCDILLSPHSGFFGMQSKLRRQREGEELAFVDAGACRAYASAAAARLEQRIAKERAAAP